MRSDFRRAGGRVVRRVAARVRLQFTAEWPALAAGGRARLSVSRVTGCRSSRFRLLRVATARATFGTRRVELAVRRPGRGLYLGTLTFSGTRFLRAGEDPNPVLLASDGRRFGFARRGDYPRCSGTRAAFTSRDEPAAHGLE